MCVLVMWICFQGNLVGVTGKVGSGKSSLLAAITAEMIRVNGQVQLVYTCTCAHVNVFVATATTAELIPSCLCVKQMI